MAKPVFGSTWAESMAEITRIIDEHGDEWMAALSFESPFRFEPRLTKKLFNKKAAAQPAAPEDEPITVFQALDLYEKCHREHDLTFFIHVFLKYGNIQKVLSIAGANSAFISRKCALYGISTKMRYPSRGHYEDITLSRIARAFPVQTAKVILKEQCQGLLTFSSFFQQDLPLIMEHTIFAGLIPKGQSYHEIVEIAAVLNMEISVKLAKPEEKKYLMTKTVEDAIKHSKLHINKVSRLNDEDEEKLEILMKAGVLDVNANGGFKLSALTMALKNKLPSIQALYSLKYSEAVEKLNS